MPRNKPDPHPPLTVRNDELVARNFATTEINASHHYEFTTHGLGVPETSTVSSNGQYLTSATVTMYVYNKIQTVEHCTRKSEQKMEQTELSKLS
jgi:hypothetical protein